MRYGFITKDGKNNEFVGSMSMSIGSGMQLDSRFGYDASKRPQSITMRKKTLAKTASINIAFDRTNCENLFTEIEKYESLAGSLGNLIWNEIDEGFWCIKDVSFSFSVDSIDIISSVQISMSLAEGHVSTGTSNKVTVRLL